MREYLQYTIDAIKHDHTPTLALAYYGLMHIGFAQEESFPFDSMISTTAIVGYVGSAISGIRGGFNKTAAVSIASSLGILAITYGTANIESVIALVGGTLPPLLLHKEAPINYYFETDPEPDEHNPKVYEFPLYPQKELDRAA